MESIIESAKFLFKLAMTILWGAMALVYTIVSFVVYLWPLLLTIFLLKYLFF